MGRARIGAILPHAPLLLEDVAGGAVAGGVEDVRGAARAVASELAGTVVVISPHATRSGVYISRSGDLAGFGVRGASVTPEVDDELARSIARRWGRPLSDQPLDHGVVVPLLLGPLPRGVVGIGLAAGAAEIEDEARSLAAALVDLPGTVSVVASVNTGGGVTASGPLTELPRAVEAERCLAAALESDVATLDEAARVLAADFGSCGLGPLLVLSHLFAGSGATIHAHAWPFGVGYLVASLRVPA
ncbi:MAG: hypothetical protein M3N53_00480 [Actinomycetota bacterium]|nr:hypothetical protein [Actinomycetota bacterium]